MDGFVGLASQPDFLKNLAAMLVEPLKLRGFFLDKTRRWEILQHLAEQNFDGVLARVEAESKRDPSAIGVDQALGARVAIPSESVKKESLQRLGDEKDGWSFNQRRVVMTSLFPEDQMNLRNQFSANFFSSLEKYVGPETKSDFLSPSPT